MNEASLLARLEGLPRDRRTIVAIAGAPGSGKSTLAERVMEFLNLRHPGRAEILPMDGYHFDDQLLTRMGRLAWKGAPDTFDVEGLSWMLRRLGEQSAEGVAVPVFDRDLEIARAGARILERSTEVIIAEGNYLMCRDAPWSGLHRHFDLSVMIDVPERELRRRLRERWISYGLDDDEIRRKLEENDIPNGRFVKERSKPTDIVLRPESKPDGSGDIAL